MKKVLFFILLLSILIGCEKQTAAVNEEPQEPKVDTIATIKELDAWILETKFDTLKLNFQPVLHARTRYSDDNYVEKHQCVKLNFNLQSTKRNDIWVYTHICIYMLSPQDPNLYLVSGIYSSSVTPMDYWRVSYVNYVECYADSNKKNELVYQETITDCCVQIQKNGVLYDVQIWMRGQDGNYYAHHENCRDGFTLFYDYKLTCSSNGQCPNSDWWKLCYQ